MTSISIHALLAESDLKAFSSIVDVFAISIHALLAESDCSSAYRPLGSLISIHALLAESDPRAASATAATINFYPRSPCGERLHPTTWTTWPPNFYPRSPCGEQRKTQRNPTKPRDFYPRSPCGERHMYNLFRISYRNISIHALLA